MADQRAFVGAAVAGTSLLAAWRNYRRAEGKVRKARSLFSLLAAASVAFGVIQTIRGVEKSHQA